MACRHIARSPRFNYTITVFFINSARRCCRVRTVRLPPFPRNRLGEASRRVFFESLLSRILALNSDLLSSLRGFIRVAHSESEDKRLREEIFSSNKKNLVQRLLIIFWSPRSGWQTKPETSASLHRFLSKIFNLWISGVCRSRKLVVNASISTSCHSLFDCYVNCQPSSAQNFQPAKPIKKRTRRSGDLTETASNMHRDVLSRIYYRY